MPSIPDFCYFVNLSVTLQTAFFPDHLLWYKVNVIIKLCLSPKIRAYQRCNPFLWAPKFVVVVHTYQYSQTIGWRYVCYFQANYMLAMGPLMTAIMVWKNSLVFHSLDKLTSMYNNASLICILTGELPVYISSYIVKLTIINAPGSSMPSPP